MTTYQIVKKEVEKGKDRLSPEQKAKLNSLKELDKFRDLAKRAVSSKTPRQFN
jgi:hypothetical protein